MEYESDYEFLKNKGGIVLAVLIGISTIIFLILFYDSIHIEKKISLMIPNMADQVTEILSKIKK